MYIATIFYVLYIFCNHASCKVVQLVCDLHKAVCMQLVNDTIILMIHNLAATMQSCNNHAARLLQLTYKFPYGNVHAVASENLL